MTVATSMVNRKVLRDLVQTPQPTVSLYLALRPDTPTLDTSEDLDLRWRAIADDLLAQGAPLDALEALARRLETLPTDPIEVALFASNDGLLLQHEMPGGVTVDQARYAAPARIAPLLAWLQQHPAHVVVVADRTGAEVTEVGPGQVDGHIETVVGPDDEIERNAPGGLAQPRYQRRAEDSWRHNAGAVAHVARRALRHASADLLLIAGDVRAVQLIEGRLREQLNSHVSVCHLPGGRQPDGSVLARQAAIADQVSAHADRTTAAILDHFDAERGPRGRAVEGIAQTLAALAAGRVETLIVVDDPHDDRRAWFGPDILCVDDPSQTGRPVAGLRDGRLVDVAVRAALLTDGDVRVLDRGGPAEGIGALCRFH
ncbi:MAG: Vms1/Ankzf1 family peptidyl-tRNA hydrolase [Micromonosporaceae bacterium]